MQIEVLKSKIHRATITDADLNYVGSCGIDEDLIDAAGLLPNEKVHVLNVNNGERFETYVIKAPRGSGKITLNGAAARRGQVGDIVVIVSYGFVNLEEAKNHQPMVVFPDCNNKLT